MKFSLVMATVGRSVEVEAFLRSLVTQTHTNFELIVVDQNTDSRVKDICARFSSIIPLVYIHSERRGLSVNRNLGLARASGEAVCFPDDDCEYAPDTLERAAAFFAENRGYGFYTCNTCAKDGGEGAVVMQEQDGEVSAKNFLRVCCSITLFIRKTALPSPAFDERLGAGAEFGSGEESDMVLRLLFSGQRGFYCSSQYIFHPHKADNPGSAYKYGLGFGALCKKAVSTYRFFGVGLTFLVFLAKEVFKILFYPYSSERRATVRGRVKGFLDFTE